MTDLEDDLKAELAHLNLDRHSLVNALRDREDTVASLKVLNEAQARLITAYQEELKRRERGETTH